MTIHTGKAKHGAIVLMTALTVTLSPPAIASAAEPSTTSRSVAATAASDIAADVKSFRASMNAQLTDYLSRYGPRLTEAERTRVDQLIVQSDKDLVQLAVLSATTASWERRRNISRARRAAATAATAYTAAYARAEAAVAELTPILKPYLNIFEALDAQAALDKRMADYRALGSRLRQVKTQLRR